MKRVLWKVPVAAAGVAAAREARTAARGGGTGDDRAGDRWLTVTVNRPGEDVRQDGKLPEPLERARRPRRRTHAARAGGPRHGTGRTARGAHPARLGLRTRAPRRAGPAPGRTAGAARGQGPAGSRGGHAPRHTADDPAHTGRPARRTFRPPLRWGGSAGKAPCWEGVDKLSAAGEISIARLATHSVSLDDAPTAYDMSEHRTDGCVRAAVRPGM